MKKLLKLRVLNSRTYNLDLKMKLSILFLFAMIFTLQANNTYSQKTKITLDIENSSVGAAIHEVEARTEFKFIFNSDVVDLNKKVSIKLKKVSIEDVLKKIFIGQNVKFEILDRKILLKKTTTQNNISNNIGVKFEQEFEVLGQILDNNGTPLPGANVLEKGTSNGTQTDFDGNFSLNVSSGDATLVVSYIGFTTKEVPLNGQNSITITIEESAAALDEVVVIGYGTQKKTDLTGAVSSLKAKDLNPGANASVDQMMQGRAAGVQITQSSAEPGGGLSIRVRGASSINAGNEPLYVIDGFPIDNSPPLSGSSGDVQLGSNESPRNPLNSINPNDIESIEILKDASSTAIYGSRGANGVILITTKKGREGRVNVNYSQYTGFQDIAKKIDVLNTTDYINGMNDISVASGDGIIFTDEDIQKIGKGTDWQDEIYRTAFVMNHDISASGGDEKTTFFTSLNYYDQDGVVKNTGIEKYIARFNLERNFGEYIKMGVNFNTSLVKDNSSLDGINNNEEGGPIYSALLYDPTEPIYDSEGNYNQSSNLTINNPLSIIDGVSSLNETNRTFGNIYLNFQLTGDLSAKINVGSDRQTSRRDLYNSTQTLRGESLDGIANISTLERSNELIEFTMSYSKEFNENHIINALGGVTYQNFTSRMFSGTISSFPSDVIGTDNLGLGDTGNDELTSYKNNNSLLSYLGRVNYSLYNKFLITASLRADGSSRFGKNNKYGYFPSFALGWKLAEEEFIPEVFNNLKLRASWGETGNQEIGNYASQSTFTTGPNAVYNNTVVSSVIPSRIANPDLKWETTSQFNVGLDVGMFNNRVSATLDYFIKTTKDMLFNLPLPVASGYESILTNIGEMENKGVEVLLNTTNILSDNFKWSTSLNFSAIKNEVKDLGGLEEIVTGNIQDVGNTSIIKVGSPLASYYGYEVDGLFQQGDDIASSAQPNAQPGYPKFVDINGDDVISPADQTIIGDPFPDFTYGIQNSFSFKNWQLDVFMLGQEKADLLNINVIESMYPANFRRNRITEQVIDRWTPENTDTKWPSGVDPFAYGGGKVNSLVLQNASYFRLKSVQIAYSFSMDSIDVFKSLRVYVTGQNLATITDYSGFDPEANSLGGSNVKVDYSSYPISRTFLFGINVGF
ncbi:TonB-dependent receptor [Joostella sp.]|uniref:TonB-dependent receptor n=1 Tax=Joostella sp. TaxID=2231138 RepID=UPI003A94AC1B